MRSEYHTQHDTAATVDFAQLERICRFYALLLLSADADPGGILDHAARARELATVARKLGDPGAALAAAADRHRGVRGRAAFTAIGRGLLAVDAHGTTTYPHAQAARDVDALERALVALAATIAAPPCAGSRAWAATSTRGCSRPRRSRVRASARSPATRAPPGAPTAIRRRAPISGTSSPRCAASAGRASRARGSCSR